MRRIATACRVAVLVVPLVPAVPGCVSPGAARRTLHAELDAIFDQPRYSDAFWGVRVEKPDGTVLYDRNGHKNLTPASNLKLYTSAAALETLGEDFTYETRLDAIGAVSAEGVLDGDLVMVGSGDPSFGAWHPDERRDSRRLLARWAAAVRNAGIQEVRGDVIGDGRCFTAEYYCPEWPYDDLVFWYGAGSSGLAIEENAYRITIRAGEKPGDPATVTWTPPTDYLTVINEVKTVAAGVESTADSVLQQVEGNVKRVAGVISLDKKEINERGSVWDGPRYAAHLFREALVRAGVTVRGQAVNARSLPDTARFDRAEAPARRTLATYTSPPMRELVKVINKPSHNFFADQIQRTLGLRVRGEGSFSAGAKVVKEWLAATGAPEPQSFTMYDGSGLARSNMVQPRQTCHLLRHMSRSKAARAFRESLPVAGVDGTISTRMKDPRLQGKVRAKTGYISNTRCLSGYVTDADGEELVFSMMCNHYLVPTSEVNASQDAACLLLAQFSERARR